jgi:hypothetical protein
MAEKVKAETGIAEKGEMRSRIGERDAGVGIAQHAAHRGLVGVEQSRGEDAVEIFRKAKIEQPVERRLSRLDGKRGDASALETAILRPRRFDELELLPFAVEEAHRCRARQLLDDAAAKLGIGIDATQRLASRPHRRQPGSEPLEG